MNLPLRAYMDLFIPFSNVKIGASEFHLMWTQGLLLSATLLLSSVNLCLHSPIRFLFILQCHFLCEALSEHVKHRYTLSWVSSEKPEHILLVALLPSFGRFWVCGPTLLHSGYLEAGVVHSPQCICRTSHHAQHLTVRDKCLMSEWKSVIISLGNIDVSICLTNIYLVLTTVTGSDIKHIHIYAY